MIRDSRWIRASALIPAIALLAVATGIRSATAVAYARPDAVTAEVLAQPLSPVTSDAPQLKATTGRASRKLAQAHLIRVRRTQHSGTGGAVAPALETLALALPLAAPLQLLPSPATVQDRLDRCTRAPRPPPQA